MKIREQALWWLGVAKRDLERAKRSLEEGDKGAATFWSQQAAEKALKAVLLATKGDFPETRSIRRLFQELGSNLGLNGEELEEAYELTQFYYLPRYPDIVEGVPDEAISERTARRAVAIAERVVKAARETLERILGQSP